MVAIKIIIKKLTYSLVFAALLISMLETAHAETIALTDDELPNESVVPTLDSPLAVKNRTLSFSKRWSGQAGTGWLLDEPFYQNLYFEGRLGYHWNETSGIAFKFMSWSKGVSTYGQQFTSLNFNYAHGPESGFGASYENRFIYGKVSFAKDLVLPVSMSSTYDLGMIQYGSKSLPYAGVGLGNSIYVNQSLGLTLGVKFLIRQAFDPLSQSLRTQATPPTDGDFKSVIRYSTSLDLGLIYLL